MMSITGYDILQSTAVENKSNVVVGYAWTGKKVQSAVAGHVTRSHPLPQRRDRHYSVGPAVVRDNFFPFATQTTAMKNTIRF